MDLNVQNWKEFRVGSILACDSTILSIKDELSDGNVPFVSRTAENNGIDGFVDVESDKITDGNCLTIGAEGIYAFYQPDAFATGNKVYQMRNPEMNQCIGLFLATILNMEDYKYSYGRARIMSKLKDEIIKLPVQHNPDGTPVIDADKTYSDEGYVPDWQFMEDYIKSLHSEPITTTRGAAGSPSLGVDKWEEFKLSTLFDLQAGKVNDASSLEDGDDCLYLGAKWNDNGVMRSCKRNDKLISKGNCIIFITDGAGSVGYSLYKDNIEFMGTINLVMGYGDFLNSKRGMFLATVICRERDRYSFGRKWKTSLPTTIIRLPIQRDAFGNPVIDPEKKYSDKGYIPDWDFMERYIDSLPYSDKIA